MKTYRYGQAEWGFDKVLQLLNRTEFFFRVNASSKNEINVINATINNHAEVGFAT